MGNYLGNKIRSLLFILVIVAISLGAERGEAQAQDNSPDDQALIEKFAPVLYFHPTELFRPQAVEVLLGSARLRQQRSFWFDTNVLSNVSIAELFGYRDESFFIDAWYGSDWASDSKNYSSHRTYYHTLLSPDQGDYPVVAYAHVVRDERPIRITIQYWFFYFYNDWFNKHEGDWEMVQVMLDELGDPEWVVYSQHHGGTRRSWSSAKTEEGTHPVVYVALGSHANYFWGDEIYPHIQDIGNMHVEVVDRTGSADRTIPKVILLPERDQLETNPVSWPEAMWLMYKGHWGESAEQADFGGPLGPAYKGDQWDRPYAWGIEQPLDTGTWYANRLRVEVTGVGANGAQVSIHGPLGESLPGADFEDQVAILHTDPGELVHLSATILIPPDTPYGLIITEPDLATSQVTAFTYTDLPISSSGQITLTLGASHEARLEVDGILYELAPSDIQATELSVSGPGWIWMAGALPVGDLLWGSVLGILAAVFPALFYVGMLYWSDRYEKEPASLLAVAFFWGALPALVIAILVRIFYQLPPNLLSPQLLQFASVVLLSPLLDEVLKGVVVVFIASRYRREFDDVLDGIIYGAMVGVGFAMTGNILSYLGSFLTRGYAGLGSSILIEGVLYSLDHASYTAIFGAGVGYFRLSSHRWRRVAVPAGAFLLAVVTHGLHNVLIQNAVNLNLAILMLTWSGVLVLVAAMAWALDRQRRCLKNELVDQLPEELFQVVSQPLRRARAEFDALIKQGVSAWREKRKLHRLCAEYAFKCMQARLFPSEKDITLEATALWNEIKKIIARE